MPDSTALPADVGLCACSARNSKRATRCHVCGETLPWVKVKPAPKAKVGGAPQIAGALKNKPRASIDSEVVSLWAFGLVVFVVSIFVPIGFSLSRFFMRTESPLANFAVAGTALGFALIVWGTMGNAVKTPFDSSVNSTRVE